MLEIKVIFVKPSIIKTTSLTRSKGIISNNNWLTQRESFLFLNFFDFTLGQAGLACNKTILFYRCITKSIILIIYFFKLILMIIFLFLIFLLFNLFVLINKFESPCKCFLFILFFLFLALFGLNWFIFVFVLGNLFLKILNLFLNWFGWVRGIILGLFLCSSLV